MKLPNGKVIFLILLIASLAYTFPVYNKYWAPFDEGIVTVAAERLMAGEVPYRDFFIIMYPPGQVYVLAFLFKLFLTSLIIGRIYAVLVSVGLSIMVFYMARLLTKNILISFLSWFITLISAAPRLGAIPSPILPGVLFGLVAIFFLMKHQEDGRPTFIVLSGLFAGLAILFRHDIGLYALCSTLIALVFKFYYDKKAAREALILIASASPLVILCIFYLVFLGAGKDMADSLILFPFIHEKTAIIPFPQPCFDLNMIFHGGLHFIMINQYYIPVLVYFFTGAYLVRSLIIKRLYSRENIMVVSLVVFGMLTFNQVRVRTDVPHLLTVIQPAVILFGFILGKTFFTTGESAISFRPPHGMFSRGVRLFILLYVFIVTGLFMLLSIKNVDKYIKNAFRKAYKKDIIETQFDVGRIYIPKDERNDLLDVVKFVKDNTKPTDKIYVGNIAHWKDDFGGSLILYTLTGRLPSTKYYELAPGLVTDPGVQKEIKESLIRHNVKLIVLQDIDLGGMERKTQTQTQTRPGTGALARTFHTNAPVPTERLILDTYISRNYRQIKKFGKYNVLVRQ